MKALRIPGCMAVVTIPLMADLAFAQGPPSDPRWATARAMVRATVRGNGPKINPAPAPHIGVGLPMVGSVLAALLLVRRFRRKD
jgi:hypothetical protein